MVVLVPWNPSFEEKVASQNHPNSTPSIFFACVAKGSPLRVGGLEVGSLRVGRILRGRRGECWQVLWQRESFRVAGKGKRSYKVKTGFRGLVRQYGCDRGT